MAILNLPAISKGSSLPVALNKSELEIFEKLSADSHFSNTENWKNVSVLYKSVGGNQSKILVFKATDANPETILHTSASIRDNFAISNITIFDHDGGSIVIKRDEMPSNVIAELDLHVPASLPVLAPEGFEQLGFRDFSDPASSAVFENTTAQMSFVGGELVISDIVSNPSSYVANFGNLPKSLYHMRVYGREGECNLVLGGLNGVLVGAGNDSFGDYETYEFNHSSNHNGTFRIDFVSLPTNLFKISGWRLFREDANDVEAIVYNRDFTTPSSLIPAETVTTLTATFSGGKVLLDNRLGAGTGYYDLAIGSPSGYAMKVYDQVILKTDEGVTNPRIGFYDEFYGFNYELTRNSLIGVHTDEFGSYHEYFQSGSGYTILRIEIPAGCAIELSRLVVGSLTIS